jgi:SAM-dependent methyltransferase
MSEWGGGYVTNIQYTTGFYRELAPAYLSFACLLEGVRPPPMGPGAAYLELGCGQGFGTNLLAAANPGMAFTGVDFMPGHIANARRLARDAGLANVTFEDLSFEQLLARSGEAGRRFEFIVLHGIYGWVSPANRKLIVELADRLLQPGGLLYVSYNCLPGWAPMSPIQRFIKEFADRHPGNPVEQASGALKAAKELFSSGDNYFSRNKSAMNMLEQVQRQNPRYLVHEYLPASWSPLYHADVAADFAAARLDYACSANLPDNLIELSAPAHAVEALRTASDTVWRETMLDYLGNKQFRRDLFMRGVDRLPARERDQRLFEVKLALTTPEDDIKLQFRTPLGQVNAKQAIYKAVITACAEGPKSVAEIVALPALKSLARGGLRQILALMVGAHYLAPVAPAAGQEPARARPFNEAVLGRIAAGETLDAVACGLTGSGRNLTFVQLLGLAAHLAGASDAAAVEPEVWATFERSGRRWMKGGEAIEDKSQVRAELDADLAVFFEKSLPILKALGAI